MTKCKLLRVLLCLVWFSAITLAWAPSWPGAESDAPVAMVVPGGEAMKYWSRWRGPSGQGLVEGGAYPDTWSETEDVLWKVKVPGRGHSSPIIWSDRIFLTTAAEDGSNRSVLCFQRSDGKLLWQTAVPAAPAEKLYQKNSYASASPVAVGGKIFFTNDEGDTFVLNPAPDFKLLHINRLGERTLASSALVDGMWYFRTQDHLICIGAAADSAQ
jgi:outer membrane protein assembly factor BamB